MKAYPAYKDSGVAWLGEVPEHWEVKRVKYLADVNRATLTERTDPEFEFYYIDIGNVTLGKISENISRIKFENAPSRARRILRKGDTIISTVRTYLKAIALFSFEDDEFIASTGFTVVSPQAINEYYFAYLMMSEKVVDTISSLSVGVSYPAVNASDVANIPIWYPPDLHEQTTIANYLGRKTAQIDAVIAKKERLIELLREERIATISHTVTKGLNPDALLMDSGVAWLGEVPEHWELVKLKFLSKIKYGLGQPPKQKDGGLPLIRATNVERGKISEDDLVYVDPDDVPYSRDPLLKENDIIVVRSGAYTGDSAIIPSKFIGAVTGYDMVVRATQVQPDFLAQVLLSDYALVNQIYPQKLRAAQPHLNAEELGNTLILVPPLSEQTTITNYLDQKTGEVDKSIARIEKQIELLYEYRTALISAVVTGKIDVRQEAAA